MCKFSAKLIAWLDHELPGGEAAAVEEHLGACAECRGEVAQFRRVSAEIEAFCEAAIAPTTKRRRIGSTFVVASSGVAAAAVLVLFAWSHVRRTREPVVGPLPLEPATFAGASAAPSVAIAAPSTPSLASRGNALHGAENGLDMSGGVQTPRLTAAPRTVAARGPVSVAATHPRAAAQPLLRKLAREGPVVSPAAQARLSASGSARQAAAPRVGGWFAPEPPIEIEIPADAIFAPGAVPQGMNFRVEMTVAEDGSAQILRVLP